MSMSSAITRAGLKTLKAMVTGVFFVPADDGYDAAHLVLHHATLTSRPPQHAGPRRGPVRRSDLEALLFADNLNGGAAGHRVETERAGSR